MYAISLERAINGVYRWAVEHRNDDALNQIGLAFRQKLRFSDSFGTSSLPLNDHHNHVKKHDIL